MEVQASPGPSALRQLGSFKQRLGSIDPRRSSPTALPPPLEEEEEHHQHQQHHQQAMATSTSMMQQQEQEPEQQQQQQQQDCSPQQQHQQTDNNNQEEPPITTTVQVMEELLRAREAFMCKRWGAILRQAKAGKPLSQLTAEQEQQQQQQQTTDLQALFQAAEGDIRGLVRAYMEEDARQGQVHESLLAKKAEVEALLLTLEEAQTRLAKEEVMAEKGENEELDKSTEGEEEVRQLEKAVRAAEAQGSVVDGRLKELQIKLEQLKATAAAEGAATEEDVDDNMSASTAGDEEEILAEVAKLREHAEWMGTLLETLQNLYGVTVKVQETENDKGEKEVIMRLGYPSKHALELALSTASGGLQLMHAHLEFPPSQQRRKSLATTEAQRLMMNQVDNFVTVAQGLAAPQDLLFLAREVGWMVHSRGVAKQEIRELMKRYIVKHNEALDELMVTFAEGVVASFSFLAGYPQMPGSVRIASLVGVGGWKDAELAVTSRSLNGLGLDSLTGLVDSLAERIRDLDA